MENVWFEKLRELSDVYMPPEGPAETEAGELVRAVSRIIYRYLNDGDMIGTGYGNETCNAAARYVKERFPGSEMAAAVEAIWGMRHEPLYETGLGMLAEQTVKYIEDHPEMKTAEAEYDCLDFDEPEDREWAEEEDDENDEEDDWWGYHRPTQRELDLAEYPPLDWRR